MQLFRSPSLRQMHTVPYVVLVLLLAGAIGGLSYSAGRAAVDTLSNQLLSEMVYRIAQTAERHVLGAEAVLETAFPGGLPAPARMEDDFDNLRTRFWLATSVHREPNNYAYYGDRNGQFFGLWRHSETAAELRLRRTGSGARTIYRFSGIAGELKDPVHEKRVFEPPDAHGSSRARLPPRASGRRFMLISGPRNWLRRWRGGSKRARRIPGRRRHRPVAATRQRLSALPATDGERHRLCGREGWQSDRQLARAAPAQGRCRSLLRMMAMCGFSILFL